MSSTSVSITLNWDKHALSLINERAHAGLFRMAYDIARTARPNAPYKTGALRNSIRVREGAKNTVQVIAGGNAGRAKIPYGAIHEWGGWTGRGYHTYIKGKHYMEKALILIKSGPYLKTYFGGIV